MVKPITCQSLIVHHSQEVFTLEGFDDTRVLCIHIKWQDSQPAKMRQEYCAVT